MIECGTLRVAQIVKDSPAGGDGVRAIGEAASIERVQAEVFAQDDGRSNRG